MDSAARALCDRKRHYRGRWTIARFVQSNERGFCALFAQVLSLCAAAGLVKLGVVFSGRVAVVAAQPRQSWIRTWWLALREWVALGDTVLLHRGC